eukprot:g1736.t1
MELTKDARKRSIYNGNGIAGDHEISLSISILGVNGLPYSSEGSKKKFYFQVSTASHGEDSTAEERTDLKKFARRKAVNVRKSNIFSVDDDWVKSFAFEYELGTELTDIHFEVKESKRAGVDPVVGNGTFELRRAKRQVVYEGWLILNNTNQELKANLTGEIGVLKPHITVETHTQLYVQCCLSSPSWLAEEAAHRAAQEQRARDLEQQLASSFDMAKETKGKLQAEINNLRGKFEAHKFKSVASRMAQRKEVESLRQELQSAGSDLNASRSTLERLTSKMQELKILSKEKHDALQQEIEDLSFDKKTLYEKQKKVDAKSAELQVEVSALLDELKDAKAIRSKEGMEAYNKLKDKEDELVRLQEENLHQKKELQFVMQKYEDLKMSHEHLANKCDMLGMHTAHVESDGTVWSQQERNNMLHSHSIMVETLRAQLMKERRKNNKLLNQHGNAGIEDVRQALKKVEADKEYLETTLESAKQVRTNELKKFYELKSALQKQIFEARQSRGIVVEKLKSSVAQNSRMKREMEILKKQLREAEIKLKEVGQVVPVNVDEKLFENATVATKDESLQPEVSQFLEGVLPTIPSEAAELELDTGDFFHLDWNIVKKELWHIFTFYTLSSNPLSPDLMSRSDFIKLLRDCGIVTWNEKDTRPQADGWRRAVTSTRADLIYSEVLKASKRETAANLKMEKYGNDGRGEGRALLGLADDFRKADRGRTSQSQAVALPHQHLPFRSFCCSLRNLAMFMMTGKNARNIFLPMGVKKQALNAKAFSRLLAQILPSLSKSVSQEESKILAKRMKRYKNNSSGGGGGGGARKRAPLDVSEMMYRDDVKSVLQDFEPGLRRIYNHYTNYTVEEKVKANIRYSAGYARGLEDARVGYGGTKYGAMLTKEQWQENVTMLNCMQWQEWLKFCKEWGLLEVLCHRVLMDVFLSRASTTVQSTLNKLKFNPKNKTPLTRGKSEAMSSFLHRKENRSAIARIRKLCQSDPMPSMVYADFAAALVNVATTVEWRDAARVGTQVRTQPISPTASVGGLLTNIFLHMRATIDFRVHREDNIRQAHDEEASTRSTELRTLYRKLVEDVGSVFIKEIDKIYIHQSRNEILHGNAKLKSVEGAGVAIVDSTAYLESELNSNKLADGVWFDQ